MELLKKNKQFVMLSILAVVFFFIYSYLPISQISWQKQNNVENVSLKFNTPDEVVNYYFTSQYAQTGELYYFEPLDGYLNRVIFPRWAFVIDGKITPGNFMGIDLIYGNIAKIFSNFVIPFLTPLFAVLGVLFFYLLIKHFFDKRVVFISTLLVLIFPGFWYYASRTMFHNVLFLALLIIGLYCLIKFFNTQKYKWPLAICTGLFFALSLMTRMSEVVWVCLMVLMILMFNLKRIKEYWLYLLIALVIFTACFIPVMYHNKILYDNYFSTGYNLNTMTQNLEDGQVGKLNFAKALVLPFGFHPRVMLTHVFYKYVLKLFWPWLLFWLAGLIFFIKHKDKTKEQKLYVYYLLPITYYLFLYYGSWFFQDTLDPNLISVGSSYIRYLLPAFILSLPLIALLFVAIWNKKKLTYKISVILVMCLLFFTSFMQTMARGPESLLAIKNHLIKYQIQTQDLLKYINENDIILMDVSTDKVLFPDRKRLIVPQAGVEWPEIKKILNNWQYENNCCGRNYKYKTETKVYYFHHTQNVSQHLLNEIKFNPQDLEIDYEILINGGGKLYTLYKK